MASAVFNNNTLCRFSIRQHVFNQQFENKSRSPESVPNEANRTNNNKKYYSTVLPSESSSSSTSSSRCTRPYEHSMECKQRYQQLVASPRFQKHRWKCEPSAVPADDDAWPTPAPLVVVHQTMHHRCFDDNSAMEQCGCTGCGGHHQHTHRIESLMRCVPTIQHARCQRNQSKVVPAASATLRCIATNSSCNAVRMLRDYWKWTPRQPDVLATSGSSCGIRHLLNDLQKCVRAILPLLLLFNMLPFIYAG